MTVTTDPVAATRATGTDPSVAVSEISQITPHAPSEEVPDGTPAVSPDSATAIAASSATESSGDDFDALDDVEFLDDIDFTLDDVESRIAPLALALD